MAANTTPIFAGKFESTVGGAILGPNANTATDGTGANMYLIETMTVDGSWVNYVKFKATGSPAATVIRLWYCTDTGAFTGGTTNTAANTALIGEKSTASWTASNTFASPEYVIPIRAGLPAGTKLLVSFGTSTGAAGNGFSVFVNSYGF